MPPVCVVLQFCANAADELSSSIVRVAPRILFLRRCASNVGKVVLIPILK
jgi:hypothetical protein